MSDLPTDEELFLFTVNDPQLESRRVHLMASLEAARNRFTDAHLEIVEWSGGLGAENPGLAQEAINKVTSATQAKENARARIAEIQRLLGTFPAKTTPEKTKSGVIAREASK